MTTRWPYFSFIALIVATVAGLGGPVAWRHWNDHCRSQLSRQCRLVRNAQKWNELQALANDWTRWDPQNGEAWWNQGAAARGRQAWAEAAESFWQVPESSPQAIPAMIELSKLAFTHLNQPLKGEEACADPEDRSARCRRATAVDLVLCDDAAAGKAAAADSGVHRTSV